MRGDFSIWNKEKSLNFRGTLHQQGRVLLDRDWNAQTEIFNDWQETAARDTIGAGVAAVPADAADGFKVTKAEIVGSEVVVSINRGRVWADGLLVELNERNAPDTNFKAEYLAPPIQNPKAQAPSNPPNSPVLRDAVILETWLEELNAFQLPELLIEPALGGVDTTERMHTAFRFRLFRMNAGDTCASITSALKDNFPDKGKLRATLQPDTVTNGDCPVVEGGGYTGFEHQLYRVEIAESTQDGAWFKWSQFNGGLVGRGFFDDVNLKVDIKANRNQIINSGLTDFYLEAVEFDTESNFWRVIYGAKVSLDSNNLLTLPAAAADVHTGAIPSPKTKLYFFRLWNGIERINDFTAEKELQDGIHLRFEAEAAGKYTPNDYWTFPVRAGEIENPQVLFESKPPEGIVYHRVPLAEINWRDDELTEADVEIEDCRRIFQPLTKLKGCCSYRVGDGINSHGDFTSINAAINALPEAGGEICVLPGTFRENIVLKTPHNRNITIKGCGTRSRIIAADDEPAIHVAGGGDIKIESLAIEAHQEGVGILLEGDEIFASGNDALRLGLLKNINLHNLEIKVAERSAIEMRAGQFVSITNCRIIIEDAPTDWAAVYLAGDDVLFEENEVRVVQTKSSTVPTKIDSPEFDSFASSGNAEKEKIEDITEDPQSFSPAQNALGGLHLSGGCERVRVINNLIIGGVGNGINLGSVGEENEEGEIITHYPPKKRKDKCKPKPPYIEEEITEEGTRLIAGAPLRDILIERNRIYAMGRNGIGVDAYFVVEESDSQNPDRGVRGEFITIENLRVLGNRIEFCLNRPLEPVPGRLSSWMGYGGISLAWVENLIVRDNFISDNGANYLEPVCGIFVLIGEGVEISRNRITGNGRLTGEPATEETIKKGMRSGVLVFLALPGTISAVGAEDRFAVPGLHKAPVIFPDGVPALMMRENVVGVTMGRTLMTIAMGNVSIVGNQFLSQSAIPGFNILNFLSSNILIFNLGRSPNLKPQMNFQMMGAQSDAENEPEVFAHQQSDLPKPTENPGTNTESPDQESILDRIRGNMLGGGTLFSNNQCRTLNAGRDERFRELCSILIVSLADIGFHNNQCSLTTMPLNHLVQALVIGMTVRFSDNHLEEMPRGVALSGITYGLLNTTTDNHSTHCLFASGRLYVNRYNLSLFDAEVLSGDAYEFTGKNRCEDLGEILKYLRGEDD